MNYKIEYGNYSVNDNLALSLYDDEGCLCRITVNLGEVLPSNLGYLDTNNLPSYIIELLEKNQIFYYTGKFKDSGFCSYPLCVFNFDKINEFNKK